jgi:hypothetical protein
VSNRIDPDKELAMWMAIMRRHRPQLLVFPSPPEPDRRCLRRIELQRLVHEDGRWAAVQVTVRAFGIEVRLALSRGFE